MQAPNVDKDQVWQRRIDEARAFPGGVTAYCQSKQISSSKFYYWRGKLAKKPNVRSTPAPSRFTQVEVIRTPAPQNNLPDPRWIAELIRQLQLGGGR